MPISIIIPVFNKWELTRNCLFSLKKYTPEDSYEVIVIDNNSTDKTPLLAKEFGQSLFGQNFRYVRLEQNINFGPACNLGAKLAKNDLVFFLNNDTFVTPNWLAPLLEAFGQDPNLGAVGPLLLYQNNTVQHLGVYVNLKRQFGHLYRWFPKDHPVVRKKRSFHAITGAAMLMARKFFLELGGFYPKYKNGFEDVDLCLKITQTNKKLQVVTESIIYHLESQSPGRNKFNTYNSLLLQKRWKIIKPDGWLFYQEDGYQIKITKYLNLWVNVNAEQENILLQDYCPEYKWFIDKLKKEPFWWNGYKKAFAFCLTNKQYQNALTICSKASYFYPLEKILPWLCYLDRIRATNNLHLPKLKNYLQEAKKHLNFHPLALKYLGQLQQQEPKFSPLFAEWKRIFGKQFYHCNQNQN